MRLTFILPLWAAVALLPAPLPAQEPAAQPAETTDSHAELADALVALLQQTAATLEQCTDADSVAAALPALQARQEEAAKLMARQAALPEPTVQDYMAAQARANDFLDAKRSIQASVARLQQAGLLSAEIRQILGIAPEKAAPSE